MPTDSDESELDEEVGLESRALSWKSDAFLKPSCFALFQQEDEYLVSTFDINEFQFEIKEDMFGLGYKRLNVGNLFGQESQTSVAATDPSTSIANLLFPTMADNGKKNAKSIAGQVSSQQAPFSVLLLLAYVFCVSRRSEWEILKMMRTLTSTSRTR